MKGSRNSMKMSKDKVACCCCVIVLILIGLYFLVTKNNLLEGFESQMNMNINTIKHKPNPEGDDVHIILFYADWCPHCVSAKPEWGKLVKKLNNTKVNNKNVKVQSCNCEEEGVQKEAAADNNISGYPTIKCLKAGGSEEYKGAREFDALANWVKEMCE
tara:strand:+ start:64 stop:540 length:477 start_codon:yes stop_codon:yes gene_type:complete